MSATVRRTPSAPLGLLLGVGVLAGVALGSLGVLVAIVLVAAMLVIAGSASVTAGTMWRPLLVVAIAAGIGWGRAAISDDALPTDAEADVLIGSSGGYGTVVSMPQSGTNSERVILHVDTVMTRDDTMATADLRIMVFLPAGSSVNVGDRLRMIWSYTSVEALAPGFADYVKASRVPGVASAWATETVSVGTSWRRHVVDARRVVRDRLERLIPGDAGALASGIVTGDDAGLSDATVSAFQHTGTSHVTAVSGQNIAMLLGAWAVLFRSKVRRRMFAMQVLILLIVWAYALFVGMSPPAVRAALFASLVILAPRSGHRPDMVTILFVTIAAMLLWDPTLAETLSFWLSMVSSAALITTLQWRGSSRFSTQVKGTVLALIAAQLATVPITISSFGTWSMGSIVANLLIAPLIGVAFPLTFALALLATIAEPVAERIAFVPEIVLRLVIEIVAGVDQAFGVMQFAAIGPVAVAAIGVLCVAALVALSVDVGRWRSMLAERYGRRFSGMLVGWMLIWAVAVLVIAQSLDAMH